MQAQAIEICDVLSPSRNEVGIVNAPVTRTGHVRPRSARLMSKCDQDSQEKKTLLMSNTHIEQTCKTNGYAHRCVPMQVLEPAANNHCSKESQAQNKVCKAQQVERIDGSSPLLVGYLLNKHTILDHVVLSTTCTVFWRHSKQIGYLCVRSAARTHLS